MPVRGGYHQKSFNFLALIGWLSLRSAFASIWRIRSLDTPYTDPISSSVSDCPSSKPVRSRMTLASLGDRESRAVKRAVLAAEAETRSNNKSPVWMSSCGYTEGSSVSSQKSARNKWPSAWWSAVLRYSSTCSTEISSSFDISDIRLAQLWLVT